jgi:hypothetical protein
VLLVPAAGVHADSFADRVVSYTIGAGGGKNVALLPGVVLGGPRGGGAFQGSQDTLSLGLGGSIVLEFTDNVVADGPGPDLLVFENAFLRHGLVTGLPYVEPATVSVSADGVAWSTFPCHLDQPPYYPGCAGIYPVFAITDAAALVPSTTPIETLVGVPVDQFVAPAGAGGDAFDLADVGLAVARFVRIEASMLEPALDAQSGFDLDAVAALHTALPDDRDGDGVADAVDDCPTVADPAQTDTDGDGIGDACEVAPHDADADGVPDAIDDCPLVANADQRDADRDGIGDACDDCPADADAAQVDTDADGVGDACDPCPADAACGPVVAPVFSGGGRTAEGLLTYAAPATGTTRVPRGQDTATVVVVIAPEVEPGSVRLRIGRRLRADLLGNVTPGSTRTITIPLARKRTVVHLQAAGRLPGGHRSTDMDTLVYERSRS